MLMFCLFHFVFKFVKSVQKVAKNRHKWGYENYIREKNIYLCIMIPTKPVSSQPFASPPPLRRPVQRPTAMEWFEKLVENGAIMVLLVGTVCA